MLATLCRSADQLLTGDLAYLQPHNHGVSFQEAAFFTLQLENGNFHHVLQEKCTQTLSSSKLMELQGSRNSVPEGKSLLSTKKSQLLFFLGNGKPRVENAFCNYNNNKNLETFFQKRLFVQLILQAVSTSIRWGKCELVLGNYQS